MNNTDGLYACTDTYHCGDLVAYFETKKNDMVELSGIQGSSRITSHETNQWKLDFSAGDCNIPANATLLYDILFVGIYK